MMSISGTSASCNCDPAEIVTELTGFVDAAVLDGSGMRDFERGLFDCLLAVGFRLTEEFLQRQGDGDCGDTCESSGNTLYRSEQPVARRLRSIFGEHQFETFVYRNGRHPKTAIASRPVDERLGIGPERHSPLVQEFSLNAANAVQATYTNEPQQYGAVVSQRRSTDTTVLHADALGTTRLLTSPTQTTSDTYLYDAWGNLVTSSGSTVNPFRWFGRLACYYDSATTMSALTVRPYAPPLARWTSNNTLGIVATYFRTSYGFDDPMSPTQLRCLEVLNAVARA